MGFPNIFASPSSSLPVFFSLGLPRFLAYMESIRVVQAFYRAPLTLTHQQKVTRLYRTALRTLDSWACDREIFLTRGAEIRERFNRNKKVDEG